MNDLEWHEASDGYESDGYRIRRLAGSPRPRWRLEARDCAARASGRAPPMTSIHATLREAKSRARRDERERIRLARTRAHVVIGTAASLTYVAVSSTTLALSMAGFAVAMILFYVALGSFADALEVWWGEGWGWARGRRIPARLSWFDRWLVVLMKATRRRALAVANFEPAPAVLPLPPEPLKWDRTVAEAPQAGGPITKDP